MNLSDLKRLSGRDASKLGGDDNERRTADLPLRAAARVGWHLSRASMLCGGKTNRGLCLGAASALTYLSGRPYPPAARMVYSASCDCGRRVCGRRAAIAPLTGTVYPARCGNQPLWRNRSHPLKAPRRRKGSNRSNALDQGSSNHKMPIMNDRTTDLSLSADANDLQLDAVCESIAAYSHAETSLAKHGMKWPLSWG